MVSSDTCAWADAARHSAAALASKAFIILGVLLKGDSFAHESRLSGTGTINSCASGESRLWPDAEGACLGLDQFFTKAAQVPRERGSPRG